MLTAMRVREDVGRVSALIYGYLVQLYVQLYRSATTEPAVSVHGSNSSNCHRPTSAKMFHLAMHSFSPIFKSRFLRFAEFK